MGWTRKAYYASRAEMEAGIGWVAAAGWSVESVARLPGGGYEVLFSPLEPRAREASPGRDKARGRLPFGFRIRV